MATIYLVGYDDWRWIVGALDAGQAGQPGGPGAKSTGVARYRKVHRHAGFFLPTARPRNRKYRMGDADPKVAQQIARAASAFEERRTGHAPRSVSVVLAADTLVVTLHGTLSEAEKLLARTPEGAAQVQEFHRRLFEDAADPLRAEIKRITGVAVREARAEIEPATGAVVQVFTTGTMVQVFLLDGRVTPDTWSGPAPHGQP